MLQEIVDLGDLAAGRPSILIWNISEHEPISVPEPAGDPLLHILLCQWSRRSAIRGNQIDFVVFSRQLAAKSDPCAIWRPRATADGHGSKCELFPVGSIHSRAPE